MVLNYLVVMLHPIFYRLRAPNVKYEAVVPVLLGKNFSVFVTWISKSKDSQPNVARTKAITWIISSTWIFFIQIEFILVLLNLVKLCLIQVNLVIYLLLYVLYLRLIYSTKYSLTVWYVKKWGCNIIFSNNSSSVLWGYLKHLSQGTRKISSPIPMYTHF